VTFCEQLITTGLLAGTTTYVDHFPGDEENSRIVVKASINDGPKTHFIVDTGAPWCIVSPELLDSRPSDDRFKLRIRGVEYEGYLTRADVTLIASNGRDVTVNGTFFVPLLYTGDRWKHPNFLGYQGFLSRLRFALDPPENALSFAAVE